MQHWLEPTWLTLIPFMIVTGSLFAVWVYSVNSTRQSHGLVARLRLRERDSLAALLAIAIDDEFEKGEHIQRLYDISRRFFDLERAFFVQKVQGEWHIRLSTHTEDLPLGKQVDGLAHLPIQKSRLGSFLDLPEHATNHDAPLWVLGVDPQASYYATCVIRLDECREGYMVFYSRERATRLYTEQDRVLLTLLSSFVSNQLVYKAVFKDLKRTRLLLENTEHVRSLGKVTVALTDELVRPLQLVLARFKRIVSLKRKHQLNLDHLLNEQTKLQKHIQDIAGTLESLNIIARPVHTQHLNPRGQAGTSMVRSVRVITALTQSVLDQSGLKLLSPKDIPDTLRAKFDETLLCQCLFRVLDLMAKLHVQRQKHAGSPPSLVPNQADALVRKTAIYLQLDVDASFIKLSLSMNRKQAEKAPNRSKKLIEENSQALQEWMQTLLADADAEFQLEVSKDAFKVHFHLPRAQERQRFSLTALDESA